MPELTEISITRVDFEANACGPHELAGHSEISVWSVIDQGDPSMMAGHAPDKVRAAASWAAGVLARIALAAQPLVLLERATHPCNTWTEPGITDDSRTIAYACSVFMNDLTPTETSTPSLAISVRTANAAKWIKRVTEWLREIDEAG